MAKSINKTWTVIYSLGIVIFMGSYYFLDLGLLPSLNKLTPFIENLSFTLSIIFIILLLRTILEGLIYKGNREQGEEYNLKRVTRLVAIILIIYVVITFMFQQPYQGLAGLGIISLIIGFALQAPISSFIAWLYIVVRKPYKVGDRIEINEHKGDVIEVRYLDTILEEFSGNYLVNDRLSGRIIHFPNSMVLKDKVINYSGQFKPFIWNETVVQISYTSDLDFVESCLIDATTLDFKEKYPNKSTEGIEPAVYFRNNKYAWMEAVVSYPVEPFDTTGRRNRILRYALPLLNAEPDKVRFPEGTRR